MNLNSNASNTYAIWVGNETAASAPFRLKRSGALSLTKLLAINEDNTETEVNLRTVGLWKLNYSTVKQGTIHTSGGYCTSFTLSNGTTVNFKNAASARSEGWSAAYGKVVWPSAGTGMTMTVKAPAATEASTPNQQTANYAVEADNEYAYIKYGTITMARKPNPAYNNGWNNCLDAATELIRYTRSASGYGGPNYNHYIKNGDTYLAVGTDWYKTTQANAYSLPEPRT
jgi:hypothetical protein